jgi:hypothetical protein
VLEFTDRGWKRERYWDELVERTGADAVHFKDHSQIASFDPPDGNHLGKDQAIAFSRALGRILVRKGITPGPHND